MPHTELNNLSSFLVRHQQLFQKKNILICGQLQSVSLEPLLSDINATFLIADYSIYNQLLATQPYLKEKLHYGFTIDDQQHSFDAILLFMPKAKQEAGLWLSTTLPALKVNSDIFLIGENRGGISSAPKLLQQYSDNVQKLDSARHCSLFYAKLNNSIAQSNIDDLYISYSCHLAQTQPKLKITALPGVFSAKELDEGTQLLLASLPDLSGDILDIGCGAGVIGATLCHRFPTANVVMTDINALAVASAQKTLMTNRLTAHVTASDMFSDISSKFDFIISNPPFHAGLSTHYAATEAMLREAPAHLKKHGKLFLVANKFLRYEPILAEVFHSVAIISENSRFKIIRAF